MNENRPYGAYVPPTGGMPVQNIPAGFMIPPWADPQKKEQKELRKAASRLSLATAASVPLSTIFAGAAGLFLGLCGVSMSLPAGEGINGMPPIVYYLFSSVMSFLTLVLPFALFLVFGKHKLTDSILVEKTGFFHGALLAFAGLFICILMNIPANLIASIFEEAGLNGSTNTDGMIVNSTADVLTLILSVVLVAPVAEEFAFRGITVSVMRRWGDWSAVFFSGLIFALAHYSFQALPVVFTGGFVMALLYVWTRNIWITIFVHFLNNLVASLPIVMGFYGGEAASNAVSNISMLAVGVLGVLSIIVLTIRHATGKHRLSFRLEKGAAARKKVLWLFINPGFIIYFILFIIMAVVALYAV